MMFSVIFSFIATHILYFALHLESSSFPKPLSAREEIEAFAAFKAGDMAARDKLIQHNLRLVAHIVKKYYAQPGGQEDFISIGTIGLIKAVNSFDNTKGARFATYASRCIENEILMYLRKNNGMKTEISIDEPLNVDWDGNELLLSDILGTDEDMIQRGLDEQVDRQLLHLAMEKLSDRERKIMELRFGINRGGREKTQKEVADLLGISQSYISRLEKRIILRLRRDISKMINS